LIFINGARVLPRDIPAWLGHEATDIPSDEENEDKTVEEAKSWTEIVLEDDGTVAITVPFHTSVCCKEVFISHPALDKHMSVAHNDTFRRYKCALCTKTFARYKQAAVHHGFCKRKNSREKVVARAEDAQKGTRDNPIEILDPYEDLATEETEEADLVQGQTKIATPTFQCEECDKTFSKKTGLSQHERYRHPNLRNAKRVAEKQNDIERKRLAREKTREQAEETEGSLKPKRTRWSEAETKMLLQLEVELQGSKQINVAIAGILESKTAKQIYYKRSMLSKAKQPKGQTPPLDAEPVPIPAQHASFIRNLFCCFGF
jgi:transposase-like protein